MVPGPDSEPARRFLHRIFECDTSANSITPAYFVEKNRLPRETILHGGGRWIRTIEVVDNRFPAVCPFGRSGTPHV